ncbi:MAG: hypothetical protein IPH88_17300 [Bacteroidales bacterium]|nr:hypothetical protein [Bacteroidales bacterium]
MKSQAIPLPGQAEVQIPSPIPYTVRIGVTGHRELMNIEAVNTAIAETLGYLKALLESVNSDPHQPLIPGHTAWKKAENIIAWKLKKALAKMVPHSARENPERQTPFSWQVVSALAKGADRMVARAAMEKLNASLEVILPFKEEDYCADFKTAADLAEFKALYSKASYKLIHSFESEPAPTPRNIGYRRAGEKMVETCDIIIAVWDGEPARGGGGTAEIVEYASRLNRTLIWINPLHPDQPACLLFHNPKKRADASTFYLRRKLPTSAAEIASQFVQVAEYNRDPARSLIGFNRAYQDNLKHLDTGGSDSGIAKAYLDPLKSSILPHYAMADHLAIYYNKKHIRSASWLYRLATIAVLVSIVQALFLPAYTWLIIFEILALVSAVIWYRLGVVGNWHEKWLNYRHLAERLRILIFTSLVPPDVGKSNNSPVELLPFYPSPGGWVESTLQYVKSDLSPQKPLSGDLLPVKLFVRNTWINYQAEYHIRTAYKKSKKALKDHKFIGILLSLTLIAAAFHLSELFSEFHFIENIITVLVVILPAIAASQHAIGGIHDFERIASRSERMAEILHRLERAIDDVSNIEELTNEIRNAEEVMATENHEWCVSLSFRRISLPV